MLPVLIYEPDASTRVGLADGLSVLGKSDLPRTRVGLSAGSMEMIRRAVLEEKGITLAIIGIPAGQCLACTELSNLVMRQNRNNYTLFYLHDPADLAELLDHCMRPAGILTAPLTEKNLQRALERILIDYQNTLDPNSAEDCLIIEGNGSAYRIAYNQILYLEALSKLLTIHTERQSITVRQTLTGLEAMLPDYFLRCHRAYLVNARCIDHADFSAMLLQLRNGDSLPISRGQRNPLKQALQAQKGGSV